MKAVVMERFGGPEVLIYKEIPIPEPTETQVLIKVAHTSVNYADIKNRKGTKSKGSFPLILGLDAAGTIVKTGSGVDNLRVGQRVIAFPSSGSYAEYMVAEQQLVFPIPDELDFQTAAASPIVSFLAYALLKKVARMEKGESILIHAASGGVGTTAIQLAKYMGAGEIIGTVSHLDKAPVALEAGADQIITYKDFVQKVNEKTNDHGVDIVLDSISGKISEASLECLAPYGRLIHFGNSSGEVGSFHTTDLHASCRSVLGFSLGTTRNKKPELIGELAKEVIPLLASKVIDMKVGEVFPLEEAAEAHRKMESRTHTGKIVLTVNN
ncbi:zinc-binding dehydrogenase [Radiobacillus kanasensis]|uniref:quinone oxidoreductase family protein n=1 Tax=Radiobacillus kanasensis TaxID=2844358 RepID=UPI001E38F53B|nr:zinc-binding dehydrogenase [Radiobacillus kanasensis]UFU00685.1 zinc-binding dehydrogenase [Radiobacillus kanasensis]